MSHDKYLRQTVLPEISQDGQMRLRKARVLCVGVGGLGSPAALYLAAAGVGTLGLIDPDRVDATNLHRQILFEPSEQGTEKVFAAKARLEAQNPDVMINTHVARFSSENAARLLTDYDLVLDGSDNFETRFLVNDAAFNAGLPLVYGAVNAFEGQVALFEGTRGACYRCFCPVPPKAQIRNCAEAGVLGSIVGTVGTLQATLALQYLISGGDPKHPLCPQIGQLTLLDLRGKWHTSSVAIPKRPDCPTCSKPRGSVELPKSSQSAACERVPAVGIEDLAARLQDPRNDICLVDVRTTEEWNSGHIERAIHWPLDRLEAGLLPPQPEFTAPGTTIVFYCKSGLRSSAAVRLLQMQRPDRHAQSLAGGFDAWQTKRA